MGLLISLIVIVAALYYLYSHEKQDQAAQKEQKISSELKLKVQKAEALIPRVESSAFYKEIAAYLRSEISDKARFIRRIVAQEYDAYLRSNPQSAQSFVPDTSRIFTCDRTIRITSSGLYGFGFINSDSPSLDFSSHGYADLTAEQLYALAKVLTRNFDCFIICDYLHEPLADTKLQSEIFEHHFFNVYLYLSDRYVNSIIDSEVQRLQAQQSPYKNAF